MTDHAERGHLFYWRAVLLIVAAAGICILLVAAALLAGHLSTLPGPVLPNNTLHRGPADVGTSSVAYAIYAFVAPLIMSLSYLAVGAIIAWRQPGERGPLVFSLFLIAFGVAFALGSLVPEPAHSSPLLHSIVSIGFVSLAVSSYLFPDGRFTPRWTVAAAFVWLYIAVTTTWLTGSTLDPNAWIGAPATMFWLSIVATCPVAQVYRYRNVSGATERQQTKWVALGLSVVIVALTVYTAHPPVPHNLLPWRQLVLGLVLMASLLLVPVTIGVAMLRYRLWDVDVLINRTLVYGLLTVSLAALYLGTVVVLQAGMRAVTGQDSDLAIAVATLAVAALFNPWRRRVQRFIDRRFYRHRYDASQTLTSFSTQLRDKVDLEQLSGELATVVHETVQPASVMLWLRDTVRMTEGVE